MRGKLKSLHVRFIQPFLHILKMLMCVIPQDWETIIDKFGFRDRFVFSANFTGSHWDIDSQSHTLTFDLPEGKTLQVVADVLISASGALNSPLIPKLEGLESFKGVQWHSSRWNKDFDLSGKKVAVVGNGSSGIQVSAFPYSLDVRVGR